MLTISRTIDGVIYSARYQPPDGGFHVRWHDKPWIVTADKGSGPVDVPGAAFHSYQEARAYIRQLPPSQYPAHWTKPQETAKDRYIERARELHRIQLEKRKQ